MLAWEAAADGGSHPLRDPHRGIWALVSIQGKQRGLLFCVGTLHAALQVAQMLAKLAAARVHSGGKAWPKSSSSYLDAGTFWPVSGASRVGHENVSARPTTTRRILGVLGKGLEAVHACTCSLTCRPVVGGEKHRNA